MKNTSGKIALLATTLFLSACVAGGHTLYSIENMWADKTHLYIFYEKNVGFEAVTLLNVHGGVDFSNKNFYYKKIERSALAENLEIDLADGVDAGNLKYIDEDFRLEEGSASHQKERYVTNRSGRIRVPCDENVLPWEDRGVTRVGDRLFYCGNVIPVTGGEIRRLPEKIAEKLKILSGEKEPRYTATPEFSHSAREGSILVRDMGRAQYLELDAVSLEIKGEGSFPVGEDHFREGGGYSELGYVFNHYKKGNRDIQICDVRRCRKLIEPDYYRTLFAEAGGKVYALVSPARKGYSASPKLKVKVLDVAGNTGATPQ